MYSNNSLLNIEDIGINDNALFCFTNITTCCRGVDMTTVIREWIYPNGDNVGNRATNIISRSRGPQSVVLHRNDTLHPVGIFKCLISNDNVYVGIYPENSGKV